MVESYFPIRVAESDRVGRLFFRAGSIQNYYSCLDVIRPLARSEEWIDAVTGFYINCIQDDLRLSYFTPHDNRPKEIVEDFLRSNRGLELTQIVEPREKQFYRDYGGDELQFRRFLSLYPLIGLEIMETDRLHARCLFATLRLQVTISRGDYRGHLERTFSNQSPTFNSLSSTQKDEFWAQLQNWPNRQNVDWAHMFVNMVLGEDWPSSTLSQSRPPLSVDAINDILISIGQEFQIPQGWQP